MLWGRFGGPLTLSRCLRSLLAWVFGCPRWIFGVPDPIFEVLDPRSSTQPAFRECKVGVSLVGFRMSLVEFGLFLVDFGVSNPIFEVPDPVLGVPDPIFGVPDPIFEVPDWVFGCPTPDQALGLHVQGVQGGAVPGEIWGVPCGFWGA